MGYLKYIGYFLYEIFLRFDPPLGGEGQNSTVNTLHKILKFECLRNVRHFISSFFPHFT